MYNNIGRKIKTLATVISVVGIVSSVFCAIWIIAKLSCGEVTISGMLNVLIGSIVVWLGSFFAYGFGELIENTTIIAELMAKSEAEKQNEGDSLSDKQEKVDAE